jgi:hypothetical protein
LRVGRRARCGRRSRSSPQARCTAPTGPTRTRSAR